jgi:hypothetical protein
MLLEIKGRVSIWTSDFKINLEQSRSTSNQNRPYDYQISRVYTKTNKAETGYTMGPQKTCFITTVDVEKGGT